MAEVLARRNFEHEWGGDWDECPADAKPGWLKDAQETLDFLAAAGFGSVVEAKAEALEEAAAELLSDETAPPNSAKEMYNRIYAAWLNGRADAVRGEG
jgi:hypothetical protein